MHGALEDLVAVRLLAVVAEPLAVVGEQHEQPAPLRRAQRFDHARELVVDERHLAAVAVDRVLRVAVQELGRRVVGLVAVEVVHEDEAAPPAGRPLQQAERRVGDRLRVALAEARRAGRPRGGIMALEPARGRTPRRAAGADDRSRRVAVVEDRRERRHVAPQRERGVVVQRELRREPAREDGRVRRQRERHVRVRLLEGAAGLHQRVERRRRRAHPAFAAHRVVAQGVDRDERDVGRVVRRRRGAAPAAEPTRPRIRGGERHGEEPRGEEERARRSAAGRGGVGGWHAADCRRRRARRRAGAHFSAARSSSHRSRHSLPPSRAS